MGTKSGKEVKRIMMDNGWIVDTSEGSHFQMIHPDHPELGKVTVPVHGNQDLPVGTFGSIKRQTGLKFRDGK